MRRLVCKRPWRKEELGTVIQSIADPSLTAVVIWNYRFGKEGGIDLLVPSPDDQHIETAYGYEWDFQEYKVLPGKQLKITRRRG